MREKKKFGRKTLAAISAACILAAGLGAALLWQRGADGKDAENAGSEGSAGGDASEEELWQEAETTPLGKYPETVVYTLGKIAGANNANLPVGDTFEDNAYTRYLKEILNIQNENVFALPADGSYEEALAAAISDRDIPDVMVVSGRDNLARLVESGMVEDLTEVYRQCTTDTIKEMYYSYGDSLLDSATFDGKLYAFPNAEIDDGAMLLWLRADWIRELGLEDPTTMEEAMDVIEAFVENDVAGGGETVGLACSTGLIAGSDETYGVDAIFTKFGSVPENWILGSSGQVEYGSLTPETKEALGYLNELYERGVLDTRFLLRKTENIDDLVTEGKCGAVFGRWWAPNNPLIHSYDENSSADWKPYFLTAEEESQVQTFVSYDDWMYVVVRKGFEHPEIVGKYVSAIFDYARYQDHQYAREVNEYFSINVDPTARPMNINVDYKDALYRSGANIRKALTNEISITELSGLEKSYYDTCRSYVDGNLTTANGWAAYTSRVTAVDTLTAGGIREEKLLYIGDVDAEIPEELQELEQQTFLQIIVGEKPLDYFDTFVETWYQNGGEELTERIREAYAETKAGQ